MIWEWMGRESWPEGQQKVTEQRSLGEMAKRAEGRKQEKDSACSPR